MTAPSYDPERHILLRDQAHKRRIHEEGEFAEYLRRVAAAYRPDDPGARMTVFDVLVPDWPPAPRSPLQILFGGDDPFADKPWRGRQPAVDRDWWTERETSRIGRALVPNDRDFDPERMAYQWQVPIFDPRPHVLMRCWCNENGVDLVAFLRKGVPEVGLRLFETTNPHVREERATGSYSPTRRCFERADLPLAFRAAGLDAPPPGSDAAPSRGDIADAIALLDREDRSLWTRRGAPKVRAIEALLGRDITAAQRDAAWKIARDTTLAPPLPAPEPAPDDEGAREISPDEAVAALRTALGRDFRLPAIATPRVTSALRVAGLRGRNLELVEHRVLKRLSQSGIRLGRRADDRKRGYALNDDLALTLGLLFRTLAPMRSRDNMRAVAEGIEAMGREEAAYWLGMAMHRKHPRRVLTALRFLLTDPRR